MNLKNKTTLITGGSSGIGRAIAKRFIQEGAKVIVFGLKKPDYNVKFYKVDVSKGEEIKKSIKNIKKLDILVNNAGINIEGNVKNTKDEELDNIININFKGAYLMCKYALPTLEKSKGNIINISSIIGAHPEAFSSAYCSTKAALLMLTKCLAQDFKTTNVRANAILPGMIDTQMLRSAFPSKKELKAASKKVPMGRIGKPEEISNVAAFLASSEAGYLNGSCITVDGGLINTSLF